MIKFELLPADVRSNIPKAKDVLEQDGNVVFAYIFGGLAGAQMRPMSDVDIAVYVKAADNVAQYKLGLFERLTDVLGTGELDLIILNTAPVSLTGRILQNRLIISDKEPFLRHAYESATLRAFFDFRVKEEAFFRRRYGLGG